MSGVHIGLAGAGWVSRYHLEAWKRLGPRARVVAIADPDVRAAEARANDYDIPAVHESVEAMLDSTTLDAIDIAAPREMHPPLCRLAAKHGLAILCQKPLAPTLEEAEALVAELDGHVRWMIHENWRFRRHYRRVREWLNEQRIGRVRTVMMSLLTSGLVPGEDGTLPALVRQPMLGGLERMLLMEIMIHHVDTLRFLLGPMRLEWARLDRTCAQIRGEDRAALLCTTA
ncbi:MAG: Gfo/Idh/MocA family oxidoreductase, partial [Gemmatimonadetes bacterium]|nr:Gfo/Idh/MocA family oxidoreductase [Gemmatimonadota bacterium]